MREVGLAALSALHLSPDDFIIKAANAGFDFVGLRVKAATPTETHHDLSIGGALHTRVLSLLEKTGLRVVDTEFLCLSPEVTSEDWVREIDIAASLKARSFTVSGGDPEENRLIDNLGNLSDYAKRQGIAVSLEPISYQPVQTLESAVRIAQAAGAGVMADTLHLARIGVDAAELAKYAEFISMLQLCDAPKDSPVSHQELITEARTHRLSPGQGELPLTEYLAALPEDLPISIEAPNPAGFKDSGTWIKELATSMKGLL
ncbi:TIM barrel protein [Corynebacterium poyangense]|uniref:TIM barrel protein n=1 Tax=Corynebacterium poyangense TaxID=2684405 RepID=A0A7H0SQJ7_9CORY|nr:sugar phosphate isomerase/epimerase family protein [Corynebacterium poyangense]MBZ8178287.1 TIM barrel protein [Corynebacterium poyangense]QNQ90822.1 TIM barrel protein [Corynebacterium poyangense]